MEKLQEKFRLIYTTPDGEDRWGAPMPRDLAMGAFDREIETIAAHPLRGKERVRVVSAQ